MFCVFLNKFAGDNDSVALTRTRPVPSSEMAQIVASFGITSRELPFAPERVRGALGA
jgi:hypothetical protein